MVTLPAAEGVGACGQSMRPLLERIGDRLTAELQRRFLELKQDLERRDVRTDKLEEQLEAVTEALRRSDKQVTKTVRRELEEFEKVFEQQQDDRQRAIEQKLDALTIEVQRAAPLNEKLDQVIGDLHRSRKHLRRMAKTASTGPLVPGDDRDHQDLRRVLMEHLVSVTCPLVLISQVQRSGGTLLSQLFDGHPECHAHPYELHIGHPDKTKWPILDLSDPPERWFEILFERSADATFREGYEKYGVGRDVKADTFPFIFLAAIQRDLFTGYLSGESVTAGRQVLDAYMTSYFNAWLNNQNLLGSKKIVTGFVPMLATYEESIADFFDVYPDGKLISIIRSPDTWYVSARAHNPSVFGVIDQGIGLWAESARAMLRNKSRFGERVCIVSFDDLLARTESMMRYLATYVGIQFNDCLLVPTFNKRPIKANSSFQAREYGVLREPATGRAQMLNESERIAIDQLTGDLYAEVRSQAAKV